MKHLLRFGILAAISLVTGLMLSSLSPQPSIAATIYVGDPGPTPALSNSVTISGHVYTNLSNQVEIELAPGRGISLVAEFTSTSLANTGVVGVAWAISQSGTNYVNNSNAWYWLTFTPKGSTTAIAFTNLPATLVDNARKLKAVQMTNNTLASTNMAATLALHYTIR